MTDLSTPDQFKSFYNPLALDTIIYMARPRGFQHGIEKLNGTTQIPDVFDIEMLIDLFFSIIGMPKSWLFGNKDGQPMSGKALLVQDIRFLRKVKALRQPVMDGYTWLGYFHCLLKGHPVESLNIRCRMSDISGLEDQMKAEVVQIQANVLATLGQIMELYNLPKEAWIELVFKKYLHLPDDVVNLLVTSLPPEEARPQVPESVRAIPSEKQLLFEIAQKLGSPSVLPTIHKLGRAVRALEFGNREPIERWTIGSIVPPALSEIRTGDKIRLSTKGGEVYNTRVVESSRLVESVATKTHRIILNEATESKSGSTPVHASAPPPSAPKEGYWEGASPNDRWRQFIKAS